MAGIFEEISGRIFAGFPELHETLKDFLKEWLNKILKKFQNEYLERFHWKFSKKSQEKNPLQDPSLNCLKKSSMIF